MKGEAEARGIKLTYLPFIVKALVEALKLHPMLNATVDDESEEIIVRNTIISASPWTCRTDSSCPWSRGRT